MDRESQKTLQAVILAAGQGSRMRSQVIKVLHPILGMPMLGHVMEAALEVGAERIVPVLGHQREDVQDWLQEAMGDREVHVAVQEEQKGTAHAVWMAREAIDEEVAYTAILCGDVPNFGGEELGELLEEAVASGAEVMVATAVVEDPGQYGRIIRSERGVEAIVEYADATEEQRAIDEINAGIYVVKTAFLMEALEAIMAKGADNAQGEFYLTDLVAWGVERGRVEGWPVPDVASIQGVNTRVDLARATETARRRLNEHWMLQGVTMIDPASTYIDRGVVLGADVVLEPQVQLKGATRVAAGAVIESGCVVQDSEIGEGARLLAHSVVRQARVGRARQVGPSAHLRPGADIGEGCKVGNFVEVKKARLDDGAKAGHLSYLGDAQVGAGANIGAGTITCNYDGETKSMTVIGEGAFIGSNSSLVAPVDIGDGAYVGAGSVVTEDVPAKALAVGRGRQRNIEGWADQEK